MEWLLLAYKIPREPTAARVYVWRKLKQLGAIAVQDAVWVLPAFARTREHFQWLAAEIVELGGEVLLFNSQVVFAHPAVSLQEQFETPVRTAYEEIQSALKRRGAIIRAISKRYQQVSAQDYFHCPLGEQVRRKLLAAKGDKS